MDDEMLLQNWNAALADIERLAGEVEYWKQRFNEATILRSAANDRIDMLLKKLTEISGIVEHYTGWDCEACQYVHKFLNGDGWKESEG